MTTNFGEQLENCPGLETVVLVRRSMSFPVSICSVSGSVKLSGGGVRGGVDNKETKKQFIRDRYVRMGQNGMGRQFETGRAERMGPEVFSCWVDFSEAG